MRGDGDVLLSRDAIGTGERVEGTTIYVLTRWVIGQMGSATCIITTDRWLLFRGLFVHGKITTEEPPVYISEAAILHGQRALHGWM